MQERRISVTDSNRTRSKQDVKVRKRKLYFTVLEDLNAGLYPASISKKYKRSRQNIQIYITNLRKLGYVRKVGYATWELTKSGQEARSKASLWGVQEGKTIEIWRMGYRFRITHDNPIPGLKEQTLAQGGKIWQGRVLGCWILKGKETLDIFGTVGKSSDLWAASMKAINEIATVSAYLKESCHVGLDPLHALKPDIIINTPEARKIAETIHKEIGIIRTEFMDIDGGSKTGRPEMEARTLGSARNTLENLTRDRNGEITERLKSLEGMMQGFMPNQLALTNTMNMQTLILQGVEKTLAALLDKKQGGDNEPKPK